MCIVFFILVIVILSDPRVYNSFSDYSSIMFNVKWVANKGLTFWTLLEVPDIDLDHRYIRAGEGLHNAKHKC